MDVGTGEVEEYGLRPAVLFTLPRCAPELEPYVRRRPVRRKDHLFAIRRERRHRVVVGWQAQLRDKSGGAERLSTAIDLDLPDVFSRAVGHTSREIESTGIESGLNVERGVLP